MTFEVRERKLGRSDVKFEIKRDGEKFGTMTISNGSVVWFPRGTSNGSKMGTVNSSRIRPICGRNLLKPRLGVNDLEVVEGCENVDEKLKLTVPRQGSGAHRIVGAIRLGVRYGDAAYAAMT